MANLTILKLRNLKAGKWASDHGVRGGGTLVARRLASRAVLFYFRYTGPDGARAVIPLGQWDPSGGDNLSLDRARDLADSLSVRYRNGSRDLRSVLDAEERERERLRASQTQEAEEARARATSTVEALLSGYVEHLRRDGRPSAREVERTIRNHVRDPWPRLWATPADQVETTDLLAVLSRLADAGKLREAAKTRSYLRAAYSAALRARQDARGLPALRDLKITHNPASDLVTIDGANGVRERALSLAELRFYWQRISTMSDATGALLRFHLLTGGQRIQQLARLKMSDFDADSNFIRLRDGKGRRKTPRVHDVPLLQEAVEAMYAMRQELGPYLFTVTFGESGASYYVVQHRVRAVALAMEEAGELEREMFSVGDLRRTVETRLSADGFQPFELAQLQSHGLGGVQSRHYNKYDYMSEKRDLLEALLRLLTTDGPPKAKRRRSEAGG